MLQTHEECHFPRIGYKWALFTQNLVTGGAVETQESVCLQVTQLGSLCTQKHHRGCVWWAAKGLGRVAGRSGGQKLATAVAGFDVPCQASSTASAAAMRITYGCQCCCA